MIIAPSSVQSRRARRWGGAGLGSTSDIDLDYSEVELYASWIIGSGQAESVSRYHCIEIMAKLIARNIEDKLIEEPSFSSSFKEFLEQMPDVGTDEDFERSRDLGRPVDL
jgi:hypothetical protein